MIKIRYVLIIALFILVYITYIRISMLGKQKDIDQKSQAIENLEKEHGELLEAIYRSNKMVGEKLYDCNVSSVSGKFMLSNLLTNDVNYVFRFSNTNCFDCLKQQVDILESIGGSKKCLLITKFGNNRQIEIFGKQFKKSEIYNMASKAKLFENEDDGRPLFAIVNNNLQILTVFYCDDTFKKFHSILIP